MKKVINFIIHSLFLFIFTLPFILIVSTCIYDHSYKYTYEKEKVDKVKICESCFYPRLDIYLKNGGVGLNCIFDNELQIYTCLHKR